ncbi:putative E3 ubiquitin-protein ligase RF298 isoform X2 [Telopea speciosissima]|uniref:putative E3 ubiquitin-protein ligase RF298 isoform X2 n=1 Tax=Telopea speciosissima TaxID=54955 RepID=UPI001CC654F2|nr:putative E3 ubiquitin-protein ligase RF298 isoform X2 [Telopea speciosissima]
MAATVAGGSSSGTASTSVQLPVSLSVQEKGSRNKRKFRADPPLIDPNKLLSSSQSECPGYEFSAEKSANNPSHDQCICDLCGHSQDQTDALKSDLSLSATLGPSEVGPSRPREELDSEEVQEADWNDLTESQLEELVLSNLDTIFKNAIKKIAACGYSDEVTTKAVLRSGLCYGCKDTVSNIADNTLAFLRTGQDIDSSRENFFEDLLQLEKYILAEMVCVLREVRPFFSVGDAMWCLLICDMNVSHACAIDGDPLSSFGDEAPGGSSSVSTLTQLKLEANSSEVNLPNLNKSNPEFACPHTSQSETHTVTGIPNLPNPRNPLVLEGLRPEKEGQISQSDNAEKSSNVTGDRVQTASQSSTLEEKPAGGRKGHSNISKRESILRQKSLHLEKNYRAYGSKGALRAGKLSSLGGLILDKKLKSVPDSSGVNMKISSLKTSKVVGVDESQADGNRNLSLNAGTSTPSPFNPKTANTTSTLPTENAPSSFSTANTPAALPSANTTSTLPTANTELSLSLFSGSNTASKSLSCNVNGSLFGIPYDKSLGRWVPQDEKDEMILKLVPRVRRLQSRLHEWTEWANQKVMQAARRLSKDKDELKSLRQEIEEVVRLKKEKQTLEENTMKKLSEMEYALGKATGQVERANSAVRRLEVENAELRHEMEAAKVRAVESAASCQEVSKREKKTLKKFQSWERQKILFQEELVTERRMLAQLHQELEQAKDLQDQLEDGLLGSATWWCYLRAFLVPMNSHDWML